MPFQPPIFLSLVQRSNPALQCTRSTIYTGQQHYPCLSHGCLFRHSLWRQETCLFINELGPSPSVSITTHVFLPILDLPRTATIPSFLWCFTAQEACILFADQCNPTWQCRWAHHHAAPVSKTEHTIYTMQQIIIHFIYRCLESKHIT